MLGCATRRVPQHRRLLESGPVRLGQEGQIEFVKAAQHPPFQQPMELEHDSVYTTQQSLRRALVYWPKDR